MGENKNNTAAAWLKALVVTQDGQAIETPSAGAYTLSVRRGNTFRGDKDAVVKLLQTAFPGCTFAWE